MNFKENCKHFKSIYKEVKGIDGSIDRIKVGGRCIINKMVYGRRCLKDCEWFEPL